MPGTRFGRYELVRRMARGGMAEIFLAVEEGIGGLRRPVVVKRILPDRAGSPDFVTMFMDEARLAARLSHPNIAHLYNFGEIDGTYFLAMELVEGLTLSEIVAGLSPKPVPLPLALRVMGDVCAGLHYAHELADESGRPLGVVHRDVSPSNVMVSVNGVGKLLDFGVAHAATKQHSTVTGELKGKLGYMAPEQFTGADVDRRTDVFAAGIVLAEMTSGGRLYQRDADAAVMHAIVYEPLVIDPAWGLPAAIEDVVRRALEKRPEDRFPTARAMQLAVEEALASTGRQVSGLDLGEFVTGLLGGERPWALPPQEGAEVTSGAAERPLASLDAPPGASSAEPAARRPRVGLVIAVAVASLLLLAAATAVAIWVVPSGAAGRSEAPGLSVATAPSPVEPVAVAGDGGAPSPRRSPDDAAAPVAVESGPEGSARDGDVTSGAADAASGEAGAARRAMASRGTLYLDTRPWTAVRADGRSLGNTPVMGARLPAGSHLLTLTDASGKQHRRRVRIRPGEATKLFLVLER